MNLPLAFSILALSEIKRRNVESIYAAYLGHDPHILRFPCMGNHYLIVRMLNMLVATGEDVLV